MAIDNAGLGITTPAVYSQVWSDDAPTSQTDQVYSAALTRRLAESAATATEILNRRNDEERITGARPGLDTDGALRQMRMINTAEPGYGFWSHGTSEDFGYPIDNAVTRAQIAEFERHRVQTRQIPITTPRERVGEWRIQEDGPDRRLVDNLAPAPELRAVRVGVADQVNIPVMRTPGENARIFGTGGDLFSASTIQPNGPDQKPSEDLEDLREDHGLRIEELESQVSELIERLEVMEQALHKVTASTIRFG